MLIALILIPLLGAALVALGPARLAKTTATLVAGAAFALSVVAAYRFPWRVEPFADQFAFKASFPLVEQLGIAVKVGADSVAMMLILLTTFLGLLCTYGSFSAVRERERNYYAWLLGLQAAVTGVFAARDLMLFYVCFEFTLIPLYVLIAMYGSANRRKAATKFFLYTFTGSIIALAGLVYVAWVYASIYGVWTFEIPALQGMAMELSPREQSLVMLALLAGFAVKVPLFPVHTWLPLAHTEAPTAGSVALAGVLLKLGTYGIYRFVLPMTPLAAFEWAPAVGVLAIVGILYTGLICWAQTDVKKLVAYSSVSHLGFCVLGLFAVNVTGLSGGVLYMINHGLSTGALFFCIGMMYERYHTRSMDDLGGLAKKMPVWAFFLVFFTMASVGLPGLNGFVSEFLCLIGAFQSGQVGAGPGGTFGPLGPAFAIVAGTGMVVAAIYLLYMVGRVLFGPLKEPAGHHHHGPLPVDLSAREIAVLAPLAAACLWLGVYPKPALDALREPTLSVVRAVEAPQRFGPAADASEATHLAPTEAAP